MTALTRNRYRSMHHVKRYFALNGEGFIGAEGASGNFRYGGLIAGGYGVSKRTIKRCLIYFDDEGDEGYGKPECYSVRIDHKSARYVRSYGQLHVGLAPRQRWRGAIGLRVPIIHDFERGPSHLLVYPEGFVSNSVLVRRVRLEWQLLVGAPDQRVSVQFAILPRIGGS